MSRLAKRPIVLPAGVTMSVENRVIHIKGKNANFSYELHQLVDVTVEGGNVNVIPVKNMNHPMVGTTYATIKNMLSGAVQDFTAPLALAGVGYRVVKIQGNEVEVSVGKSHKTIYKVPAGIKVSSSSNTEIVLAGPDKQKVNQAAAEIIKIRKRSAYQDKGIKWANRAPKPLKEAKKKAKK